MTTYERRVPTSRLNEAVVIGEPVIRVQLEMPDSSSLYLRTCGVEGIAAALDYLQEAASK